MIHRFLLLSALFVIVGAANEQSSRPITAADLVGIRDIGGHQFGAMTVSPNGAYIAFQLQTPDIKQRNYGLTWYVAETQADGDMWSVGDGGEVMLNPEMKATTIGDRPATAPIWSLDGQWIIYLKMKNGKVQLWRSRWDGSLDEQLTHDKRRILTSAYSIEASPSFKFSKDGELLFYYVARDSELINRKLADEADRGFLLNDRLRPGKKSTPYVRTCKLSSWGKKEEVSIARDCAPQLWAYEFETKSERVATTEEVAAYKSLVDTLTAELKSRDIRLFRISEDETSWLWLENENPRRFPGIAAPVRIHTYMDGHEFRCDAEICEAYSGVIEGIWFRPNTNEIVFQRADGSNKSMTGIYAWAPRFGKVRTILQTEDKLEDCEFLEHQAICLREQWTHPRTIIALNLYNGGMLTIYDPNPGFNKIKFSRIEKIEWEDEFGSATHGHLVYPLTYQKGSRYPLVVVTYRSRGFLRGGVGDEYPIHLLAANGFMVLSHDKPRSFERFATMADPIRAEWEDLHERRSSLSAQERMLEILDQRGLIDLKRTAMTGLSDGADQVRFALIHSGSFTTGIASGAFDYRAHYYLNNENWRRYWEMRFGGSPNEDKMGYWRALSLGLNANLVDEPYLANVSDDELLFSVESISRLQDASRPVEMYVYPGEYHIKWQPQHRLAIYRRNVQWLKFWLMGEEEGDPVSPDQYTRWRKLRDDQCERLKDEDNAPWYCRH